MLHPAALHHASEGCGSLPLAVRPGPGELHPAALNHAQKGLGGGGKGGTAST